MTIDDFGFARRRVVVGNLFIRRVEAESICLASRARTIARGPNRIWVLDYMSDVLAMGRRFRVS